MGEGSGVVSIFHASEILRVMEAKLDSVTVLVGNSEDGTFSGFEARFRGEEVAAYYEGEDDKVTCTLYRCETDRGRHYYRVHEADETDPRAPRYELLPYKEDDSGRDWRRLNYDVLHDAKEVLERWPLFAGALGILDGRDI